MVKIEMKIDGMHCGACATGIQMLTSSMDGVKEVFVDYEAKKGTFEFDETKVTKDQIVASIKELGYTAS
jgi:copper chaperone CopZ